MKAIKFYAIIAVLAFSVTSCVENSAKYKALAAQRDSLVVVKQALDSNYNQTIDILNDIETGFSDINQNESQMKVNLKGVEGSKSNLKEQIGIQMKKIKDNMEQNKAKIAELRRLAAKKGKDNTKLNETINRLQAELDQKGVQIQALQTELDQKNIKISELTTTVNTQSKNISDQQNVMNQQKSTIKGQDTDLNSVWYCVATSKKLKESKIVSNAGLFQPKKVLVGDFDMSAFTKVDLRNVTTIPTESKNIKILSVHPMDSYKLDKDADGKISIDITNPAKFWSVTKYLVVQI
jgi:predicted RNase H-like nuclease (RuvC/YqgF family)